jgi:putative hydrolase of the HAD superfamily
MTRQYLIIDADDTLWENNVYFEQAFEDFIAFLRHTSMPPRQVRDVFDEIELANIRVHGYGSHNYGLNLQQCYRHLAEREVSQDDLETVMGFARRILEAPVELIEGVPETLEYLALRHDLTLFTKGHADEQKLKIDRSGLAHLFAHTAIVKEKDARAYRHLVREREMDPPRTWMVGNSPKSDINPALEAGLNAVYVPHPQTWSLEHQEIEPGAGRLIVLESFAALRDHF